VTFFSSFQESAGAAERVFQIIETTPGIADPRHPVSLPAPVRGHVAVENLSFRYGPDPDAPWALQGISLDLKPGEVVALVGPSGAGKTTLASLLPRFWDVTEGRITFDGVDIRNLRLADLRKRIGLVPQEPALFSGSVGENIAYANPDASAGSIEAAARAAHAAEFIERRTVIGLCRVSSTRAMR
jgi:subfamily B ATP-binding cassette protein MsbA